QRGTPLAREFPLALVTPADHHFLNSIFGNVPLQLQRAGVPTVLIHPDVAMARGMRSGDDVRVGNARGAFFAVADVSQRVRCGVVAAPKGRWPRAGTDEATVNATVDERDADMGRGAVYHDNRVQVERAQRTETGGHEAVSVGTDSLTSPGTRS